MSKFSIPDKLKLAAVPILTGFLLQSANASPPLSRKVTLQAVERTLRQARTAMVENQRRVALSMLDQLRSASLSKAQTREVDAKRVLFAEQFFTSESFQKFQEAKDLASFERWDDCLRVLSAAGEPDQDNLMILRLRAKCQVGAKLHDQALKTNRTILGIIPGDTSATYELVEIAIVQHQTGQGLAILDGIVPKASADVERHAILKSRLLRQLGKIEAAVELLKQDQERNVEHTEVLYELGMLYAEQGSHDWAARRLLSLFVTRCKRMTEADLKMRSYHLVMPAVQAKLAVIDRKLGVQ